MGAATGNPEALVSLANPSERFVVVWTGCKLFTKCHGKEEQLLLGTCAKIMSYIFRVTALAVHKNGTLLVVIILSST